MIKLTWAYCSTYFVELSFTSGKFVKELATKYKEHDVIVNSVNHGTQENQEHLLQIYLPITRSQLNKICPRLSSCK